MDLTHKTLLVIAPHPDDEVLGCGGLIQKVKQAGGNVYVLYLTVGDTQDFSKKGTSTAKERTTEIEKVVRFLGVDGYDIAHNGDHHLKLDVMGQHAVMQTIERKSPVSLEKVMPDIVAFPSLHSYNQDHQLVAQATHAALRPAEAGTKYFVPTAIAYEMPADEWCIQNRPVPNTFVQLNQEEMRIKTQAMKLYVSQMRSFPNPRSLITIEALARLRGSHTAFEFAEGFVGYRVIM
ncbi:MAG: PIG-L family deacetylase [Patescibacteria group bacterium]